jgi:hypothetical protein
MVLAVSGVKALEAWALVGATFVAALAALPAQLRPTVRDVTGEAVRAGALPALCPAGSLPDESVCIPVPAPAGSAAAGGRSVARIPLQTDRSSDYARYSLPLPAAPQARVSWARDDAAFATDAGAQLPGLALWTAPGTPVVARALNGQQGAATAVFSGRIVGATLVTYHVVRQGGQGDVRQEYLVGMGNLGAGDLPAPRISLDDGVTVAKTGGRPLYLDVRLLRPGVDPWSLPPDALLDDASSVSVDARNVYPLAK